MNQKLAGSQVTTQQFETYFQAPTRLQRLTILSDWAKNDLNLNDRTAQDLFKLKLSNAERISILGVIEPTIGIEYEQWIFKNLHNWSQDVAAAALRSWSTKTICEEWEKLVPMLKIPGLPQRISFTILDICPAFSGRKVTSSILGTEGWEDFSPAYHGLLFERSIQFDCQSTRLSAFALKTMKQSKHHTLPDDKSLMNAGVWMLKNGPSNQLEEILESSPDAPWKGLLKLAQFHHGQRKKQLEKCAKALAKADYRASELLQDLPKPWSRCEMPLEIILKALSSFELSDFEFQKIVSGVPEATLCQAFSNYKLKETNKVMLGTWLGQKRTQESLTTAPIARHSTVSSSRSSFFASMDGIAPTEAGSKDFWSVLSEAWNARKTESMTLLGSESRKQNGLATIAYLSTLGRLVGNDESVLKIMDHIRTGEEDELRAIVNSLSDIGTARSLQELISVITRPNATPQVQQEAVALLCKKDLSALQKELRATVQDLRVSPDPASPIAEIREALENLIQVKEVKSRSSLTSRGPAPTIDDTSLDEELSTMILRYRSLSSEVRRALRTALFFNRSIEGSETSHAIDLSPLIDMQYKAMELLFREVLEDAASQALHRGEIPRKLDVIGYARPIPYKMDEFENYIANLPVVREIPFFSKFKMRKMLRAICQFEPGRRFTLDGLKAFGLFFLCFSRTQCKYGLSNLFPIGARDDIELAEFAKELHIFQDFRNRAAHEGFHPEASNDIQGIWKSTANIVAWAFRIRESLSKPEATTAQKIAS